MTVRGLNLKRFMTKKRRHLLAPAIAALRKGYTYICKGDLAVRNIALYSVD